MAKIEIYHKPTCPYCQRARRLLADKGVTTTEYDVVADPSQRDTMIERAGGRTTVPQIFIDGRHIGGCDDLVALDEAGKLDALIA